MIISNTTSISNTIFGGSSSPDTNGNNQQAWLLLGDSIAQGSNNTTGAGPTPTSGTAYYWNYDTSQVVEITSSDIIGASNGSIAPQFCIDYNTSTGKKAVIIPAGFSGSKFYGAGGGSTSWETNGTLYATMQSRATACMSAIGVSQLKGIIVILGVNDISSADTIATVETAIDSLFTRLTTDYAGVPIYVVMPGRTSSAENMNNRFALVRNRIRQNMENLSDVHLACYLSPFVGRGLYGADNLHPTQTGNNTIGSTINTYIQNVATYHKWTSSILSLFESSLNNTKKSAIDTFITTQVANGNWAKLDTFQFWVGPAQNDVLTDWRFFTCTKLNSASFSANDNLSSNGSTSYIRPEFIPSLQGIKGTVNDFFAGVWIRDNQTPSLTQGNAFGGINSTQRIQLFQNTSGATAYQAHDGGGQVIAAQIILDDTWYELARVDASTKRLLKNGVQAISVTQAATAALSRELYVGATNSTGTAASFLNCSFRAFAFGQESGFDHSSFYSSLNTLITAMTS